jgi:GTP pyrophosphokinase
MLTARFTEAIELARAHHADDLRKGTTIPYLSHLLVVCAIVLEHGGGETEAIAALLHDVVEDGGGESALAEIERRFGPAVAEIVVGCSDTTSAIKEDWLLRKERYLEHLEVATPAVLLVSASDKLHNARSILADLRELGDELWTRVNRGSRDQLWYYGTLRDVFARRLPGRLADELDRTVRDINRLADPDDRIDLLGQDCEFWSFSDSAATGAIVDWPGCPLVITKEPSGLVVHAEVGRLCEVDYEPGDDEGLDTYIDVELGDLRLEYREPSEVAWLISDDAGDLRRTCETIAELAPIVASRMSELEVMMYTPTTTYADRAANGPWFSTSGPAQTSELPSPGDRSPPAADWPAITPKPGAEYTPHATSATPPAELCECGSSAPPLALKPQRGSAEWWDDPSAFWRCPECGRYRGDATGPLYRHGGPA